MLVILTPIVLMVVGIPGVGNTLPETNGKFAPENRPGPNRKGSYSNHPCSGAKM